MIRRHLPWVLIAANVILLVALLAMWVQRDGTLRNTRWLPLAPHTTDFTALLPAMPATVPADTAQFVAMLDRPLFSPTRRPPPPAPPPPAARAEAPADLLSTATLSGLYAGGGAGGIIISMGGKHRRVQLNQVVEGWTLQSVQGRSVTFVRGGESRTLQLPRATLNASTGLPQARVGKPAPMPLPTRSVSPDATPSAAGAAQTNEGAAPAGPRAVFGGTRR